MDYLSESLKLHYELRGKLEIQPRAGVSNKDELSLAYTPGVAAACLEIKDDVSKSYDLTRLERATELKRQEVEIERERLNVEVREKAAAEKDALIFKAEAERVERQAQADAQLYEAQKEAEAIRLRGEAEAEAIRKKAEAMQLYGQAAMLEMVVDKLPEIARSVSEPLSKTEKIILFGEGGATSMARDTAGTMLQTFEAVKQAVGLDIPRMLKDVTTGGLVGKAAAEEDEIPAEAAPSGDDSQVQE